MINFFNKEEEAQIVAAIETAERKTSGEIRVHLTNKKQLDVGQDAMRIFHKLGMHQTEERNGVLILLAPRARQFAIIGDQGIDQVVPAGFWETERNLMQEHFRRKAYGEGIALVIQQIGEKLESYFPRQDDDVNELSDEISYDE